MTKPNMYYVYVLLSTVDSRLYIGKTADLKNRVKRHNSGYVKSTKAYRPWRLVYFEAYASNKDVGVRKMQLKQHAAKQELKQRLQYSLEN
jgi:putative endonuclease